MYVESNGPEKVKVSIVIADDFWILFDLDDNNNNNK